MRFADWSDTALEARLVELRPLIEEYEALIWARDLRYLIDEGFVAEEGERLYPVGDSQ